MEGSRISRLLAALAWVSASFAFCAACFNPNVRDGGLRCSAGSGLCPSGLSCASDGFCRHLDGSIPIVPDAGDKTDVRDGGGVEVACVANQTPTPASCVPRTDLPCDPVCQTGCCTTQKCSALNQTESLTLAAQIGCVAVTKTKGLGDGCDLMNRDMPSRSDNCVPGLVCVDGNSSSKCLKLCRDGTDCADLGTKCETRSLTGATGGVQVSVCGLQPTTCNADVMNAPCDGGRCYLTGDPGSDATVCDFRAGTQSANLSCKYPRDCLPKLTCIDGICHEVCTTTLSDCRAGFSCIPIGTRYGYCN